jgi:glycine betaine/proline transport system ATP-binding protein
LLDGGRIVQCGTAREIIANPVSDYVAEFVSHMNPLGVLTARDVMVPGAASGAEVTPDTPIKAVMEMLRAGADVLNVVENGEHLGVIRSADVMRKLLNPRG